MPIRLLASGALVAAALGVPVAATALAPPSRACNTNEPRDLVLISVPGGAVDCSLPDARGGNAEVLLADGHGGWFVGGGFAGIGAVDSPSLGHLNHDGTVDASWRATLPRNKTWTTGYPPVRSLALSGRTLYAAGPFGVEAVDAATGARRWLKLAGGRSGVLAVAANSHRVFIGGDFKKIDGHTQPWLAALDAGTGIPLRWRVDLRGASPMVDALAVQGSILYIGGNGITGIGTATRPGLGAVDAASGRARSWLPRTAPGYTAGAGVGDVETIVVAHGHVFTAGHDGFGITNAHSGKNESAKYDALAYRIASYGDIAYLGGNCRNSFTRMQGKQRNNLASINLGTGHVTEWAPNVATFTCVQSIAATRDEVLVAGSFSKTLG